MNTVILLSGGIDSTVALAHALNTGHHCTAISFNYGQTHAKELHSARRIAAHYDIEHRILNLATVFHPVSALTGQLDIPEHHATRADATYVPARNLTMLAIAIAHAEQHNANAVAIGANADDHDGYLDCRPDFLSAMSTAAQLGTTNHISVWAPLLRMTKADILRHGLRLDAPLNMTWSCYRGGDHPCGMCGACESINAAIKP